MRREGVRNGRARRPRPAGQHGSSPTLMLASPPGAIQMCLFNVWKGGVGREVETHGWRMWDMHDRRQRRERYTGLGAETDFILQLCVFPNASGLGIIKAGERSPLRSKIQILDCVKNRVWGRQWGCRVRPMRQGGSMVEVWIE